MRLPKRPWAVFHGAGGIIAIRDAHGSDIIAWPGFDSSTVVGEPSRLAMAHHIVESVNLRGPPTQAETSPEPPVSGDENELPFPEYGAVTLCMLEDGDVAIYQADTISPKAKLLARGESVEDAWERMLAPTTADTEGENDG